LTAIGREDLDARKGRLEEAREELDLLAVERDDADVARRDAAGRKSRHRLCREASGGSALSEKRREREQTHLLDELALELVVDERAGPPLARRQGVRVDEDDGATA